MWKFGQALGVILLAGSSTVASAASSKVAIDANVFTTYQLYGTVGLRWLTCGTFSGGSGCFGSGYMFTIDRICGMLQGASSTTGDVVSQRLYVLSGGSTAASTTNFQVWTKTVTMTPRSVTTKILLETQLSLPLASGSAVSCSMAANDGYIFVGRGTSDTAVKIDKADLKFETLTGLTSPGSVSRIMANEDGYIVVRFGSGASAKSYLYGSDGKLQREIDGDSVILNSATGLNPK